MKRIFTYLTGMLVMFSMILLVSCEGPAGIAGEPGDDGSNACQACHNESTMLTAKKAQFAESAHSLGTYYTRTGQCAMCHSAEGFLSLPNISSIADIDNFGQDEQTPMGCRSCHTIHTNYDSTDWKLTYTDVMDESILGYSSPELSSYAFGDFGNSNLCMWCHQARDRGNVPSITSTAEVATSGHWGPHYGVQGNVVNASGGVHIVGTESYPAAPNGHAKMLSEACIDCHMYKGNHSLAVNFDACASCHSSADNAETIVEELQTEVHDLLFQLGAKLALAGVMEEELDGTNIIGYAPVSGTISADNARAVWNFMMVYEDHSYGVHNPTYIKALLKNTLAAVN